MPPPTTASRTGRQAHHLTGLPLVLIALFVSLSSGAPVQAAPAPANVRFYIEPHNPQTTICTGDTVTYSLYVYSQFTSAPAGWTSPSLPARTTVDGVVVNAVSDGSLGQFLQPATAATGLELVSNERVAFEFKAGQKPGQTTLWFDGAVAGVAINTGYVTTSVPIKVIVCEYRVTTTSNWFVTQGTGGSIALVAYLRNATLSADDQGHYSGEGTVRWIPYVVLPDGCKHTDTVASSTATLTGSLNAAGDLQLTVTYGPAKLVEKGTCGPTGRPVDTTTAMTPATVKVTVPGEGAVLQGQQVLDGPGLSGWVTVNVKPVGK